MQLPSKELLSEVLDKDYNDRLVDWFQIEDDNYLRTYYDCGKFDEQGRPTGLGIEINIYELAHKCKEWAYIKHQILLDSRVTSAGSCFLTSSPMSEHNYDKKFIDKSEPEAIFQACQWILDNKDK